MCASFWRRSAPLSSTMFYREAEQRLHPRGKHIYSAPRHYLATGTAIPDRFMAFAVPRGHVVRSKGILGAPAQGSYQNVVGGAATGLIRLYGLCSHESGLRVRMTYKTGCVVMTTTSLTKKACNALNGLKTLIHEVERRGTFCATYYPPRQRVRQRATCPSTGFIRHPSITSRDASISQGMEEAIICRQGEELPPLRHETNSRTLCPVQHVR
jgi:hypothetical protein